MKVMTQVKGLQRGLIATSAFALDAIEIDSMRSGVDSITVANIACSIRTDTPKQNDTSHGVTVVRQGVKHKWLPAKHNWWHLRTAYRRMAIKRRATVANWEANMSSVP